MIKIILVAALLVGPAACPHLHQHQHHRMLAITIMLAITMLYHPHLPQDTRLGDIPPLIPHPRGITGVRGIPTIS